MDRATREVAAVLARAVRARDGDESCRLFELAVSVQPECAVAWLWLAAVAERDSVADARIRTALDLNLGPLAWRQACGELLMAIALRRAPRSPESARAILIEAQYATPRDARVWVALAVTAATPATRISYLERAMELDGVDAESIRAEILEAAIDASLDLARAGRVNAASDMLLRAAAASPGNRRIRAIAARFSALEPAGASPSEELSAAHGRRATTWWVRAPTKASHLSPAQAAALEALAEVKSSLQGRAALLCHFASGRMGTELRRSAADLTASVGGGLDEMADH